MESAYRRFFFQAEDGIRHGHVTGVQTCALPISATLARTRNFDCNAGINLHHPTQIATTKATCSGAATLSTNLPDHTGPAQTHQPRRSNPHSAPGTAPLPFPRFPPLADFGRRPPLPAAAP